MPLPTPHLEKLRSVLENEKLPTADRPRIERAIERYQQWIRDIQAINVRQEEILPSLVRLLNEYKLFVDIDIIFDSQGDFLYRQKGQLKLDNSIIEEFLPWLVKKTVNPPMDEELMVGPNSCFSAIYFGLGLGRPVVGGDLKIRVKDQDFSISRKLFVKTSHDSNFSSSSTQETYLAYVAAECKTNLDKTMFQEACATAHDVKTAVAGAKYFLICEWLDMTPIGTAGTDIDEVLILRKAKRLNSNVRNRYASYAGRQSGRENYLRFLNQNPFSEDVLSRFVNHISRLLRNEENGEEDVLIRGYF